MFIQTTTIALESSKELFANDLVGEASPASLVLNVNGSESTEQFSVDTLLSDYDYGNDAVQHMTLPESSKEIFIDDLVSKASPTSLYFHVNGSESTEQFSV